ncbi:Endonuclease/exonuclease/phosphatase [Chlamydoabsidia padenii]|nr:Endonuclease/exonuclease/phosphatase [Chlamydoabsidia padenii]
MDHKAADKEKLDQEKRALREQKKKLKQQQVQSTQTATSAVPSPTPYRRIWRSPFRHRPITIMSYNILAQNLCKRTVHPLAGDMLKWKTRRRMVIEELAYYQPDLMCLQEMDNYDEYYKKALAELGYTTLFHRHETKRHGCLIGYKDNIWKEIDYRTLDYDTDPSCKPAQITGNIGQLVALAFRDDDEPGVILGNTHLYWRPQSNYERCRQALIYMHHLFDLKKTLDDKKKGWVPLMLGDFNTQPTDPFYSIVTGKPLTEEHLNTLEISRRSFGDGPQIDDTSGPPDSQLLDTHQLLTMMGPKTTMQSVYSHHKRLWDQQDHDRYCVGEPDYTNYAHEFKGTLDYMFVPPQAILLDLLMFPPHDRVQPALPNSHFGSDHLCLMAKIILPQ